MTYPPPVTKKEREVLELIGRGHPDRVLNVKAAGPVNALEWSEVQSWARLDSSEFGDCIAHLVARDLIDSVWQTPSLFARLLGAEEKHFFWITPLGRRFLKANPAETLPDAPLLPRRGELKGADIDDAVRIFENSLTPKPYVKPEEIAWAGSVLDKDIKAELTKAVQELESMWGAFERMFGHRGPAKVGRETEMRDPVVKRTAVRVYRAKDEQRKRLGFPASQKPVAWFTHYMGGNVGLDPAPWDQMAH